MFKILLVEDNEMNRDMLKRRLERKGYEVVIAADGKEAVRMAELQTPDLILMDIRLPVMDGWEAMRRIKNFAGDAIHSHHRTDRTCHGGGYGKMHGCGL